MTLDTTRADHLGCYGHSQDTSPNLDKLAAESVLYTRALAPSSWTLPSHASLFTGKFSSSHGAQYDPEGPLQLLDAIQGSKEWEVYRARGLAQNEVTLAQTLRNEGYKTGAVLGGPWLKKVFGMNKGFDYYDDDEIGTVNGRLARQINNRAVKWIEQSLGKEFFLFLNYFDPHSPYGAPEGFGAKFLEGNDIPKGREPSLEELFALYDGEIFYMDYYIGQLIQKLKDLKIYENTMIIVTADHGELMGEHGKFGHGNYLYQEELHVPFFVKYPRGEVLPSRSGTRVQLNDIFAMILERVGIPAPPGIQGGVPPQLGHPLIAETYPLQVFNKDGHWRAFFLKEISNLPGTARGTICSLT